MSNAEAAKIRPGRPLIAIEIGNDWLKAAQFVRGRGGLRMASLRLQSLDGNGEDLPRTLAAAFDSKQLAASGVVASIPRQMVNLRILELPSTEPKEIADMVELQVGKQVPYSRDEVVLDYRIVGAGQEGYTRVMLAIVQRSVLRDCFNILEEAGIQVGRVSVSSEGVANWVEGRSGDGDAEGATAVLDVDAAHSDFVVVAGGQLAFSRSILVGAGQLADAAGPGREKLQQELRQAFEQWRSTVPDVPLARLVLGGAAARLHDLARDLGASLDVPAESFDCVEDLAEVPQEPSPAAPEFRDVSLTSLVGIAMAPERLALDLFPDSVRLRRALVQKAKSLTTLGMLIMVGLVSLSAYGMSKLYAKKERLAAVQGRLAATEPAVRKLRTMQGVLDVVEGRLQPKFASLNLLRAIRAQTPEDVILGGIAADLGRREVLLTGVGGTRRSIRNLVNNLEQTDLFRDVKEQGTTTQDRNGRFQFQVLARLEDA